MTWNIQWIPLNNCNYLSYNGTLVGPTPLFVAEGVDGIGGGGLDGLRADGQKRYHEGDRPGKKEHPHLEIHTIGEALQPFIHCKIGDGPGDDVGQYHPFGKFLGQEHNHTGNRGSQDFTDSNFFGSLFRGEGGQAEQSQTGHKDGDDGEVDKYLPHSLL